MEFFRNKVEIIQGGTDEDKLKAVRSLADRIAAGERRRAVCLQVTSQQLLRRLQTNDLDGGISDKVELHPYSFEELWAQRLFVSLPQRRMVSCPLDWTPITYTSDYRVHLVVFGLNAMSEALIKQACLVCHYPNWIRDQRLRTRITIIDPDIREGDNLLLARYGELMRQCHWSFVDSRGCVREHTPDNAYLGGDYTDVEFQLVAAEVGSVVSRVLLTEIAKNPMDLPTVVFAGEDSEHNWDLATGLPVDYYQESCHIPIYARMKSAAMLGSAHMMPQYRNLRAFGMDDCAFDRSLPLTQLAIGVSYLYDYCYRNNGDVYCPVIDRDAALAVWNTTHTLNRFSSEANAMTILTKLRSVGKEHGEELSEQDVVILSEVEHNRWSIERLLAGVRPVTPEEQEAIVADRSLKSKMKERGAHFDLRPYAALCEDAGGRNVQLYDEVLVRGIQKIVSAFEKEDSGPDLVTVMREEPPAHHWRKRMVKWGAGLLLVLLAVSTIGHLYFMYNQDRIAEHQLKGYVYQLRVDSIEVWHGTMGIDTVLHLSGRNDNVVGTAFSLEGRGVVTARHCVEYWLYEHLKYVNDPSVWTPEMRLASRVETYNDTTSGDSLKMVAVCSLFRANGDLYMDRVVFDVDRSRDQVRLIGIGCARWRYVVPVFRRDRDMLRSDVAIYHHPGEKGIRLCAEASQYRGSICVVGYANDEIRELDAKTMKARATGSGAVRLDDEVSKGLSGSPVVCWSWGHFEVVGVMSRNDRKGADVSWATVIDKTNGL